MFTFSIWLTYVVQLSDWQSEDDGLLVILFNIKHVLLSVSCANFSIPVTSSYNALLSLDLLTFKYDLDLLFPGVAESARHKTRFGDILQVPVGRRCGHNDPHKRRRG